MILLRAGNYTGTMWADIAGRLQGVRCLLPDLPGNGGSQHIPLQSLEQEADAVAALIEETCATRLVTLVGLSFGGYVALHVLARHPHLVKRAMISGIHLGAIPNPRAMSVMAAVMSPLVQFGWFRRKMAAPLGITDPQIYSRADGSGNVFPRTFRQVINLVLRFNVHDLLPGIEVPTLMIAGAKEHETILHSLTEFETRMPACTARIVPGMGHAWCNQDPALFAATIAVWVAAASLPDTLRPPLLEKNESLI